MSTEAIQFANHEKRRAALVSVSAAILLTAIKITVGLMTGSLGILAEAAHSGLDLAAALMTLFAVRVSSKPADIEHTYGHGKVENLSALFETLLLLLTCVWIVYEAVQRLFFKQVLVDASLWGFLIMIVSIGVNIFNSRLLFKTAHKYNSQALEADALHFSTDIWSSVVVVFGLSCVWLSGKVSALSFLDKADSIAALGVAIIVIYVSFKLGWRTISALLDTAPKGTTQKITTAVESIPGVINVHNLRLRTSGPHIYVDAHILVNGDQTLEEAHHLTEHVEQVVHEILPGSDVTVHPEPAPKE